MPCSTQRALALYGKIANFITHRNDPMKVLLKLLLLLILLLPLALAVLVGLALEDRPLLAGKADMTPERIAYGKQIFERYDPRRLKPGTISIVPLEENELDLALNYLAHQFAGAAAGLRIEKNSAVIEASFMLPANPLGRYLNLSLMLKQTEALPQIDQLKLGSLRIPGELTEVLLGKALDAYQPVANDWRSVRGMLKTVYFHPRRLLLVYRWQNDLPAKLSGALLPAGDRLRLEAYQQRLAALTAFGRPKQDLSELLQPMFQFAGQRSRNGDAVAENRALILVLAFYVNRKPLDKLVSAGPGWSHPSWRSIRLNGRDDFPKHYLISAMLAAYAGTPFADAVGLFKEIDDSHGGSGFSFNDLAADRAGTRLGELASGNAARAEKLQARMAAAREADFMPFTADLPEFMPDAEFQRRFGGLQGQAYKDMMAEIERRVDGLAINRD